MFRQECLDANVITETVTPQGPSEATQHAADAERQNKREFARIKKLNQKINIFGLPNRDAGSALLKGVSGKYWGRTVHPKERQARFFKDADNWHTAKTHLEETTESRGKAG